jgi:hypothetical protein
MLRVITTTVWPTASTTRMAAASARSRRLCPDRNRGFTAAVTPISTASASTMPSSRTLDSPIML